MRPRPSDPMTMKSRPRHRALALSLLWVVACNKGSTPEPTAPSDAPANATAPTDATAPNGDASAAQPAAPMGLTGVLDEEAFAALHQLTDAQPPEPRGEMIELGQGGQAYLSLPEGPGPHPGVIVIHEWWGLNVHIKHWTDRLAADGYAAIAVDLYGGEVATTPDEAMALMKKADPEKAKAQLAAAHTLLATDPRVQAPKRGVIGWCFGGGWSLQSAITLDDLDAAVIYYGRLVEDPEALAKIEAPIFGVFGERDKGIPPEAVASWKAAMESAGRDLQVVTYDAEHAFANPSGAHYDAEAAADAWGKVRSFLATHLRGD